MRSSNSEAFIVLPLLPIFLAGAFPILLMGFLGFAGLAMAGALMMSAALTMALDTDTERKQRMIAQGVSRSNDRSAQSAAEDDTLFFAKAFGAAGAALVAIAATVLLTTG